MKFNQLPTFSQLLRVSALLLTLFSSSCFSIKEEDFSYVYTLAYYSTKSSGKFISTSKPDFSYMGSDGEFDYYKEITCALVFPERRYKCKTLGERFYPHSYPFEGWNGREYYFRAYKGRIIVTPCDEWLKLAAYYKSEVYPAMVKFSNQLVFTNKQFCDDHFRMDVDEKEFKLCLTMLNQWSIQHWGQDRLNIAPMPYANPASIKSAHGPHKTEWNCMDYMERSPRYFELEDGSVRPVTSIDLWEVDARFGR